jgi:hypothetical protein
LRADLPQSGHIFYIIAILDTTGFWWLRRGCANEEALHFGRGCADFLRREMGWIGGFGDICSFKVIPLL